MNKVKTLNKGWLDTVEGFTFRRGRPDLYMGIARDKNMDLYAIYTADCGADNCYCAAVAEKINKQGVKND